MNRKALFADINKLRDDTAVVDDKKVKKAAKNKKAPTPVKSNDAIIKPKKSIQSQLQNVNKNKSSSSSTQSRKSRSKKKKKKKKKRDLNRLSSPVGSDYMNDDSVGYANVPEESYNNVSIANHESVYIPERTTTVITHKHNATTMYDYKDKAPMIVLTHIYAFISSIDMMMNLPTLYRACHEADKTHDFWYCYVLLAYFAMQFISVFVFGKWLDIAKQGITPILIVLCVCMMIGNIIYTEGVHSKNVILILFGRAFAGIGSCILILGYAHVVRYSKICKKKESNKAHIMVRSKNVSYLSFVIALGTLFGPLIGTAIGIDDSNAITFGSFWVINDNNIGSLIVSSICICYLVSLTFSIFYSKKRSAKDVRKKELWGRSESESEAIDEAYGQMSDAIDRRWQHHRFMSSSSLVLWFILSSVLFVFWSFLGAIIPIGTMNSKKSQNLNTSQLYSLFVYAAICYIMSFIMYQFFCTFHGKIRILNRPYKKLMVSLILMVIGCLFLTKFGFTETSETHLWQVMIACPLIAVGFCISSLGITFLYLSLCGNNVSDLASKMSWFFAATQFGLLCGPIYSFLVMHRYNNNVNLVAHSNIFILCAAMVVTVLSIKSHDDVPRVTSSQDFVRDANISSIGFDDDKTALSGSTGLSQRLLTDRL